LSDDMLELLREIRDGVLGLRADLAATRRPKHVRVDLVAPLRAIRAVVGDRAFSVSELLVHAAIPEGESLRSAIVVLAGALNARKVGKLFRTIEGLDIGGLRVERIDADRDGVVWRLHETRKLALPMARRSETGEDGPTHSKRSEK
jgi:hypothetical protein